MADVKSTVILQVDIDLKGLITKVASGRAELSKLKETESAIAEQMKVLEKAGESAGVMYQNLTKDLIQNKAEQKALTSEIRNQEKAVELAIAANKNSEGSLRQLQLQLSASIREWNLLGEAERESSERGKALKQSITELNAKLLEQEQATGRNQRNVGNYKSALDGVREKLVELAALKVGINKEGFDASANAVKGVNAGISETVRNAQSFTSSFDAIQGDILSFGKEALNQAGSFKELTAVFKTLRDASVASTGEVKKQLEELTVEAKKKLDDIKDSINNLASDTSSFDAIAQGVKTVVAGFTLVQGATQIFGDENEDIQKAIQKTTSALLILNSVTEITNALQKESSLVLKANAAANFLWNGALAISSNLLKIFGINVAASSVGLRIFSAALISTGIGALVIGLTLLVQNFKSISTAIGTAIDKFKNIGGIVGTALLPFKLLIELAEGAINKLKQLGQFIGLIDSEQEAQLKKNIDLLEKVTEKIGARYDFEAKLAKASGRDTRLIEEEKLRAQNSNIIKQIENLYKLEKVNGELNEDQKKKLQEYKEAFVKNYQEILVSQEEFNEQQRVNAEKISLDLLNIELKRQQLTGQDDTSKRLQIAEQEYQIAIGAAQKKGEDTSAIEADYELKKFEILKNAEDKRRELLFKVRSSQIALIKDEQAKEIEAEKLALDEKLSAIVGNGQREKQLRENAILDSEERIKSIRKKYAEEELNDILSRSKRKIEIEKAANEAENNLLIQNTAKDRAANLDAQLKQLNDALQFELRIREQARKEEEAQSLKRTDDELTRLRASNEFKSKSLEEQKADEARIIQEGNDELSSIESKYQSESLGLLKKFSNDTTETIREAKLSQIDAELELNQLRIEGATSGFSEELSLKLQQLDLQEQAELDSKQRTEEEKTAIEKKYVKLRNEATIQAEQNKLAIVSDAIGKTKDLFKRGSFAYKGLAISQAYIDTYRAAAAALAPPPTGAGPVFGPILAGTIIATGIANVARIASQNVDQFEQGGYSKEGGYTGNGSRKEISTSVGRKPYDYHKREYIVSSYELDRPEVASIVSNVIEPLRKQRISGRSVSSSGFEQGGFASPSMNSSPVFITTIKTEDVASAVRDAVQDIQIITDVKDVINATETRARIVDGANI